MCEVCLSPVSGTGEICENCITNHIPEPMIFNEIHDNDLFCFDWSDMDLQENT